MAFHWKMWKSFSWKKIVFQQKLNLFWRYFAWGDAHSGKRWMRPLSSRAPTLRGTNWSLTSRRRSCRRDATRGRASRTRRRYVTRRAASLSRSTMTKTTTPQTSITSNLCRRKVRAATDERSILTFEQMTFGQTSFDLFGRRRRVKVFDRTRLTSARTPARDDAIKTPFAGTKKLQIPGLFFLYFCPCWLQLTVNKCSMKAVGEWWIWTRILCCQK